MFKKNQPHSLSFSHDNEKCGCVCTNAVTGIASAPEVYLLISEIFSGTLNATILSDIAAYYHDLNF